MSVKPVAWRAQYGTSGLYSQPTDDRKELSEDFTAEEIHPLYDAPAPELAEALQRMVDKCPQCGGLPPCTYCFEARQLLARITPK